MATVVLAAARVLAGLAPTSAGPAAERRAAWVSVGVHRDELSSTVL
ncbi:MAG: TIGR02679 domain-containing protein [Actinokineospora sp.]